MKRIKINARGLTFDAWSDGPEQGPLVMLLHGLPRTSWEWHHQIPHIANAGYHTIAPDMRGYCDGARPTCVNDYVVEEFAKDIVAIVSALGYKDKTFNLIGTSIGATVAWRVAGNEPDRR